jgi:predicted dehydrogenase
MPGEYRVGIIGCGGIAAAHARGYKELENVQLVAACDVHPKQLAEFQEQFAIPRGYADPRALLETERLDIVSVCTWPGLHAELTIAAAEARVKGIITEKPMATSLAEAEAMAAAAERNNVKLVIGQQGRFYSYINTMRQLVLDGAIGRVELVYIRQADGLLNSAVHSVDYMRYILGDPPVQWVMGAVERRTDRYERGEPIEDRAQALVGLSDEARGVIECDLSRNRLSAGCTVFGSHGSIFPIRGGIRLVSGQGTREIMLQEGNAHAAQARELIDWIEGKREHRGHWRNGLQALEVLLAIYESERTRGVVRLPLETKENPLQLMIKSGQLPVEQPGAYDIRGYLVRKD